ncbi:hypothetical protein KIH23_00835 [Flavobacterium sp. CYK-55]|uniref:hypothetical protein n=1 Tax=Flavobacterium sp. CYK-55 TaxID=2835529 RepID=UPI001BD172A7|nr:hypothetical protein [Flavobacterium sp. CYK-55]MBS7785827.1 hypothetical protein [Flavobacterium sp. CYK-55]
MTSKISLIFFCMLVVFSLQAQVLPRQEMSGLVVLRDVPLEKVNVRNDDSGYTTSTAADGTFKIKVRVDEALVFTAVNLETRRVKITEEILKAGFVKAVMSETTVPLPEVTVNDNKGITAENLGIIPRGQRKYTQAQRRLREATTGGGIVPLNPILNGISGRTRMLKKEVQVEQKERLLLQLDGWFDDEYYTQTLKIPEDYISGFDFYIINDTDFVRALRAKNKTLTKFLALGLARNYLQDLEAEQK